MSVNFFVVFSLIASVDFKNSYDEWCVVIQKAQDKARFLLKEYDQKFVALKVQWRKWMYTNIKSNCDIHLIKVAGLGSTRYIIIIIMMFY